MSREKPLIVVLLSFFFKSPHAKVTVGGYGDKVPLCYSRRRVALYTYSATYNATYIHSVLMLTKQEDSLLIIISRLRGSLIISRLSPRTKACFDWIDDSGSEQSESSINSDHARLVTAAAVITEFYARVVCVPSRRCPAWDACWPQIWSGSSAASSEKLDTRCEPLLLSMLH